MLVIKVRLAVVPGVREVLVLPPGVLQDGTSRRALTKFEPEAVLAYDEFTRAEMRAGDLQKLSDPYDPKAQPAPRTQE